jgi:hypothetical protein
MSRAAGTHVGIRDLAGLVARAIAVELVLFETFGRWIPTTSQAHAKPLLAAAARRHAWHADMWRARFPVIPDADLDAAVAEARSNLGPLVDALAVFDALAAGPGRLAVTDHAAAALAREYRAALAAIDPLLDAPTSHVLTVVLADLDAHAASRAADGLGDDERQALDALFAAAPFPTLGVT